MKTRLGSLLLFFIQMALLTGTGSDQSEGVPQQDLRDFIDDEGGTERMIEVSGNEVMDREVLVYKGKEGHGGNVTIESNVTMPLCCGVGMAFNMSSFGCEPALQPPSAITFHYEDGRPVESKFPYNVQIGFMKCPSYSLHPDAEPDDAFHILPDGRLRLLANGLIIDQGEFCLLAADGEDFHAIVCFKDEEPSSFNNVVYKTLYPVGQVLSAFFLACTFFVYCLVVELRDLLGRCLMCSVFALCAAHVWTVIVQLATTKLSTTVCLVMAILMHFWYMAAFLWLNVISFNVFLTVCRKNYLKQGIGINRWFLIYSCYAWGLSGIICALAVARDFADELQDSFLPKPDFGQSRCWFSGDDALIMFFYGPTSVILGVNVILFCVSAYKLCSLSKTSDARTFQFTLYLKLFVLMGITWIFEVISFFVQRHTRGSEYIWVVFDLINIMQGLIIFIVFVCRRSVLVRVCEVLCGLSSAKKLFPKHYLEAEVEATNNETTIKHSVI